MKDGLMFQLIFSIGSFLVALSTLVLFHFSSDDLSFDVELYADGIVVGVLWSIGNAMTTPIISSLGLGVGMSTWNGMNFLSSYIIGRFSLFGTPEETYSSQFLEYSGVLLGLVSLYLFTRVKKEDNQEAETEPLLPEELESDTDIKLYENKRIRGIIMAVVAGVLYSVKYVPVETHKQDLDMTKDDFLESVRVSFSISIGVSLGAATIFFISSLFKDIQMLSDTKAVRASLLSGVVWAVASVAA